MGRRREKKAVEWKDTNHFKCAPKYSYTTPVLNRYLFFWDTFKHYRKVINYASNLSAPNRICCVYLLGKVDKEKVEKYIDNKPAQLIILFSETAGDVFEQCEECELRIEGYRKAGYSIENQDSIERLKCDIRKLETYLADHEDEQLSEILNENKAKLNDLIGITSLYAQFKTEWHKGLLAIGCYKGIVPAYEDEHNATLIEIAKQIFPLGIEVATSLPMAYKVSKRLAMANGGIQGKDLLGTPIGERNDHGYTQIYMYDASKYYNRENKSITPIAVFKNKHEVFDQTGINENAVWRSCTGKSKSIKFNDSRVVFKEKQSNDTVAQKLAYDIYEYANTHILRNGYIELLDVKKHFSAAPYGFYQCNWYYYVLGSALRRYGNGKYFLKYGVVCQRIDQIESLGNAVCFEMDNARKRWYNPTIYKQTTQQRDFTRMFRRLFNSHCDDDTFHEARLHARQWAEKNIHLSSVDLVDSRLYKLIGANAISEIEYGYERHYDYLKQNSDRIYRQLRCADEDIYKNVCEQYGATKADDWRRYFTKVAISKSWLWNKDQIMEEVHWFMEHTICRECDRVIPTLSDNKTTYMQDKTDLQIYHLKIKDLFSVQKKLFGRNINQYMCFDCLIDSLECRPQDVIDMIERFKDEGCTLFS